MSGTALTTYPTARNDANETKYSAMGAISMPNGVVFPDPDYGLGYLNVYADSTGMHVKVTLGRVVIAGFVADLTLPLTLNIAAANSSTARYDRIVARLDRTSPATIYIDVVTGVVGAGAPPALVKSTTITEISLAQVAVGAGVTTITAGSVTTQRSWTGSSTWLDYTPIITTTPGSSFGVVVANKQYARWRIVNGTCEFAVYATVSLSGSSSPGGALLVSLPQVPAHLTWPMYASNVLNLTGRFYTATYDSGATIYGEVDIEGANWSSVIDGSLRSLSVGGSFEMAG